MRELFFRTGSCWRVAAKLFLSPRSKCHRYFVVRFEVVFVTEAGFFSGVQNYLFEIVTFFLRWFQIKYLFRCLFVAVEVNEIRTYLAANQNAVKKNKRQLKSKLPSLRL